MIGDENRTGCIDEGSNFFETKELKKSVHSGFREGGMLML